MTSHSLKNNRTARASRHATAGTARLRLLPSGDGWSLVGPNGALVFSALGVSGRQRCLEFAQAAGVVALAS